MSKRKVHTMYTDGTDTGHLVNQFIDFYELELVDVKFLGKDIVVVIYEGEIKNEGDNNGN